MASEFTELAIDCADPDGLARFWCSVLSYEVQDEDDGVVTIGSPMVPEGKRHLGPVPPTLTFAHVPEGKTVKNRLHLDVNLDLGARHADVGQGDVSWVVLADPERNVGSATKASLTWPPTRASSSRTSGAGPLRCRLTRGAVRLATDQLLERGSVTDRIDRPETFPSTAARDTVFTWQVASSGALSDLTTIFRDVSDTQPTLAPGGRIVADGSPAGGQVRLCALP
jgi:hypothetical protein